MKFMPALTGILLASVLAGCAGGLGSRDYERSETRRVYEVKMGIVQNVRAVQLEGTKSQVGSVAGGAIGGIAGSTIGRGKGSAVAAVLGAVAGGLAGSAIEESATKRPGLELTVRLEGGRTIAVTQEDDGERFEVGDRVRLLESGGQARITH